MDFLRRVLTSLIVLIFATAGVLKLTDKIHPERHQYLKAEFAKFAKVNPCTVLFDYKVDGDLYRIVVGWVQVVGVIVLLVGPASLKVLTHLVFMVNMIGEVYSILMIGFHPKMTIPAGLTFVLLCVHLFLMSREKAGKKEVKTD